MKKIKVEEKIARVCWNDQNWQRPSGSEGKSQNINTYEYKMGFGHEEWLFDVEKTIKGYHYGYLQPLTKGCIKYRGKTFNISFYSINSVTKERWWIGKIKNVEIISEKESKRILLEYKKRGWLQEMIVQLQNVKANSKSLGGNDPYGFANIKYKPENLELLDIPLRFSNKNKVVAATYYVLLNKTKDPDLESSINKNFLFLSGHAQRKEISIAHYGQRKNEIDNFHNRMQKNVYNQLIQIYGKNNVGTELPTGTGAFIDLVVRGKNSYIFYEFKTANTIEYCIREALAQLLEYAYYPDQKRAEKLIVVSQNHINKEMKQYLNKLRSSFKIPLYYKRYRVEDKLLDENEY